MVRAMWAAGAAVTAAAAIGAVGAGAHATAHAAGLCPTRTVTVSGVSGFEFCGKASAKVSTGGKTYTFKNGQCTDNTAHGLTLALSLGESFAFINESDPNQGQPRFVLEIQKNHKKGTLEGLDSGGKELAPEGTDVKVSFKGKLPLKGTFHGPKLSGSWACAGHVYSQAVG